MRTQLHLKLSPSSLSVILIAGLPAFAGHPKVAKDLEGLNPGAVVDVIVQYRDTVRPDHIQKVSAKGARHKNTFRALPAAVFSMPAGAVKDLANDPEIVYVSPDRKLGGHLDVTVPALGANIARSLGYVGKDVGVAIIDSGIHEVLEDIPGVIVYRENFLVPEFLSNGTKNGARYKTDDDYGHGTHIAGVIVGNGHESSGSNSLRTFKGLAPGAKLISLKVLDSTGTGTDSNVIAAIDRAIELKIRYNIRVINLSLGRRVYDSFTRDPLCQAVERAWKAGIVVVVAAGNEGRLKEFKLDGYATITSPGNDPYVITVGAMKTNNTPERLDDQIASFSSKGPTMIDHVVKPDIVAPGNAVVSSVKSGFLSLASKLTV